LSLGSLDLWALFVSAFLASTLLPGGSELVLAAVAQNPDTHAWLILLVASVGNTLGGMTSWAIGRVIPKRGFERAEIRRATERLRRYGSPILLLSWVPVVGDPLCVAAGWLRVRWWLALGFIAAGKVARYAVLLFFVR
jgi:membrane protein YqaA with SNARE-associated domain